ncbi:FkbM family methyltransferase [Verrucomicrobiales bacterium]|nr:FkbM family methyltransferase [Verrucomicrobiales bacterium]
MNLLKKIPKVRGWITKWENRKAKRDLLDNYVRINSLIRNTPVVSILFEDAQCIYELEDGRKFAFQPERTAGWLYSLPFIGTFEAKESMYVRNTVDKDWVCLDVGGCFGWYTTLLSKAVGETGAVHVFEPVPDNRECLVSNILLNRCENVEVHDFALGNVESTATIYVPDRQVSGSLRVPEGARKCDSFEVLVRTLDDFSRSNSLGRVDFIKADIEGAELLLVQGGLELIRKFRPIILLEIQAISTRTFGYEPHELFLLMESLDYEPHWVDQSGNLVRCTEVINKGAVLPDYNFVFIPSDHTKSV